MKRIEFYSLLAEMLEIEASEISAEKELEAVPNWDSLAVLSFVALVDQHFGMTVPGTKLVVCKTVQDLMDLLPGKIED